MSNLSAQAQAQEQGDIKVWNPHRATCLTLYVCPPGIQNLAQPLSSNPTSGQDVDNGPWNAHDFELPPLPDSGVPELSPDSSLHSGHSEPKKDGPSLQAGHYCRLPSGQLEWVHNPFFPRGAEAEEDVEMATPLAQDSTSHVAKQSFCSPLRSVLAGVFKERMRMLREKRSRGHRDVKERSYYKALKEFSSALAAKTPKTRRDQQPIQQIPVKPSEYQKRQNRVSKNTSKSKRQIRTTALVTKMETVLEEEAESPTVVQPSNGLILPPTDEDQNDPMYDAFVDEAFEHANGWPAQCAPLDLIPPAEYLPHVN
ncbi:hypothetical protein MMC31_002583 [Peltigera leucophlebia]|nr:hypothetical protein [Peltigera leucophlebia]